MDLPEVQASARMEATIPRGDGESLERLRERTEDAVTRPAGSTTLLDANIPSQSQPPEPVRTPTAELPRDRSRPEMCSPARIVSYAASSLSKNER